MKCLHTPEIYTGGIGDGSGGGGGSSKRKRKKTSQVWKYINFPPYQRKMFAKDMYFYI